jgi:lipopolysaccharide/colanic/teichoic acid biosynthesis glycosyltransferase
VLKRTLDLILAFGALALLSPLLLAIAVLIKLDDGRPVLYRGVRVGRGGVPFRIRRFRTMVVNADRLGGPSTPDDDPRMTKVGRWLRRSKLDELPQFLNVINGEMSFVGPRPEVAQEVAQYSHEERALLSVRPGITDWASIRFRDEGAILRGAADPHEAYRQVIRLEKMRLALEYVRTASLATDVRILVATLRAVVGGGPR